jgi:hypothetical protein
VFKQIEIRSTLQSGLLAAGILIALFFIGRLVKYDFDFYTILFVVSIYFIISSLREKIYSNAIFSSFVLLFVVFAVYILLFIIHFNSKKEELQKTSFAISLSTERDPIAEYLFDDLTAEFKNDTHLYNALRPERFDVVAVYNYLTKKYFTGYWKKYDLTITVCNPYDSVLVNTQDENRYQCYNYFNDFVNQSGIEVVGSDFFYLNNYSGMIGYVGWTKFNYEDNEEVSLFLDLESRLRTAPIGYPELLLDEKLQQDKRFSQFSTAKYFNHNLYPRLVIFNIV